MNNNLGTTRCYGYVQVSTTKQANEDLLLDMQKEKIDAWCTMHDRILVKTFADESISGKTKEKRSGLSELLAIIRPDEMLVVFTMSHLSRSVKDFVSITDELNKKGCHLVCIKEGFDTSTAYGRFTAIMFAALAQLESDITSERVTDSMKHKAAKGEFVGRPPYGWKLANGKGSDLV